MRANNLQRGFSLVELLTSLVIAALLLVGLQQVIGQGLAVTDSVGQQTDMLRQARFAMSRMTDAVRTSTRLLVPQNDNPATALAENVRSQTVPASPPQTGSSLDSAVLGLTISPLQDLDRNGVADADNDGDGRIDEDLPADNNNDGEPGLRGFDDDGNGTTDFWLSPNADDDESNDLAQSEDPVNGLDDDGDGVTDEDPAADNNGDGAPGISGIDDDGDGSVDEGNAADDDEDGSDDEDWYDVVVYFVNGTDLIERRAVPWDTNGDTVLSGRDFVESVIAEGVSAITFERLASTSAASGELVDISLTLVDVDGETQTLRTRVRVGGVR